MAGNERAVGVMSDSILRTFSIIIVPFVTTLTICPINTQAKAPMMTLMSVIIDQECQQVEQVRAVTEGIFPVPNRPFISLNAHEERTKRELEIRALMRRKRGLQAEINDVNDRIKLLEAQP